MTPRTWTCQRVSGGARCGHVNPKRKLICEVCGKRRPATKRPEHLKALDLPYEHYVEINGGNFCALCGVEPEPGKKLHRDHCHKTGKPRGLLCFPDNLQLKNGYDPEWHRKAADYLERAA